MEDIYDDLENYNDVNLVEELKQENLELKDKLNDYATQLERLRIDFDFVSSEFKKLEVNYSSLLKTARAEIERKTQIITTLNNEKDMLVINSVNNSSKGAAVLRRLNNRDKSTSRKSRKDLDCANPLPDVKKYEAVGPNKRDRDEENRLPSTDTVASGNTDDSTKIQNKYGKLEYDKGESKENIDKSKRAQSLKHRRKSMPVLSKQLPKFSSDEDDDNCSAEEDGRDWQLREERSRKLIDKYKHSHKVSETSGIDDKYSSYHGSSREAYYKSKSHRYSDKYKSSRSKYEPRHKRRLSAERSRRATREYPEEAYQRSEHMRYRVLESPPVEKPADQQRWGRDRQSRNERDRSQEDKSRRDSSRHLSSRPNKHKATSDYDEPNVKRARANSCTRPIEERSTCPKQSQQVEDKLTSGFAEHLMNASCQSPDYPHHEVPAKPKEIKNTAQIKLEDPRITNPRYFKKVEGQKVTMCASSGKDIEIKLIDKLVWNVIDMDMPTPLKRAPNYINENFYQENPASNMSTESGEIHSDSNDMLMRDYVVRNFFQDYENERLNQEYKKSARRTSVENQTNEHYANDDNALINNEKKLPPVKYKIPKPAHTEEKGPNPLKLLIKEMSAKCGVDTSKEGATKLDVDKTFDECSLKNITKDVIDKPQSDRQMREHPKKIATATIEGDLELSDETCDNTVSQKCNKAVKDKILVQTQKKEILTTQEEKSLVDTKDSKTITKEQSSDKNIKNIEPSHEEIDVQSKELKHSKKTRRKSVKSKSKHPKNNEETLGNEEKKTKSTKTKGSKEHHKDTKSKFDDLFGDSCSLITPEDLGVPVAPTPTESAKTYLPICEDAQDAVDVNVLKETVKSVPANNLQVQNNPKEIQTEKEEVKEHKLNKVENSVIVNIPIGKITPNMEFSNVIATKEPDVVKTVIISSGVQPEIEEPNTNKNIIEKIVNNAQEVKGSEIPIALATSTPFKKLLEIELQSCNSSEAGDKDDMTPSADQSSTSNAETQNEDVPDVRIFVRRRRKLKK